MRYLKLHDFEISFKPDFERQGRRLEASASYKRIAVTWTCCGRQVGGSNQISKVRFWLKAD